MQRLPSVSFDATHSLKLGVLWHFAQTRLWNGIALVFLSSSWSSVLSRGTVTELSTSKINNGKTLKINKCTTVIEIVNQCYRCALNLGFFRSSGASFLAIISKNFRTRPGLGYNSISEAKIKCVNAASRAIFLPTLTGYRRSFCALYSCADETL